MKTLFSLLLILALLPIQTKAMDLSIGEFLGLNFEERVKVCSNLVSSSEIGECAAIRADTSIMDPTKAASHAKACFTGGESDSHKIAQCVRAELDEMNVPKEFPSADHIRMAYNQCASIYGDSTQLGVCTAALCTKLEN